MSFKPKPDDLEPVCFKAVGIAFEINANANEILTRSAAKAKRPKKNEAMLRLEDHLERFPDWKP